MNKKDKTYINNTLNTIKDLMEKDIFKIIDNDDYRNKDVYNGIKSAINKLNKGIK